MMPRDGELGLGQAPAVGGLGLEAVDHRAAGRGRAGILVAGATATAPAVVVTTAAGGGHQAERQDGCGALEPSSPCRCRTHGSPCCAINPGPSELTDGSIRDGRHIAGGNLGVPLESCQQSHRGVWRTVIRLACSAAMVRAADRSRRTLVVLLTVLLAASVAGCRTPGPGGPGAGPRARPCGSTRSRCSRRTTATTSSPRPTLFSALRGFLGAEADGFEYTHRPLAEQFDAGVRAVELDVFADDPRRAATTPRPCSRRCSALAPDRPGVRRARAQGVPRPGGRLPLDLHPAHRLPRPDPRLVGRAPRPPADHDPDRGQGRHDPRPRAGVRDAAAVVDRPRSPSSRPRSARCSPPTACCRPPTCGDGRATLRDAVHGRALAPARRRPRAGAVRARRQGRQA